MCRVSTTAERSWSRYTPATAASDVQAERRLFPFPEEKKMWVDVRVWFESSKRHLIHDFIDEISNAD